MIAIYLTVLVFAYLHGAYGQTSSCKSPNGSTGDCISIYNCPYLLELVAKQNRTQKDVDLLRSSHCGFEGRAPKVCCPGCFTQEGPEGECKNIYECPPLLMMLQQNPISKATVEYVKKARCKSKDQYSVCCPLPAKGKCSATVSAFPPDPRSECCGVDARVGNKITGGTATSVDQYPWLALIEYIKDSSLKLLCGSVLISGKYVLSAAHCVTGPVLKVGTPINIRLGEYDTSVDGPDCVTVEADGVDCTSGLTVIPIEKLIPHPEYNLMDKRNDIALIRMSQMAPFDDFIRPICLPTMDIALSPPPPSRNSLYAAGWGAINTTVTKSNIKQHVALPYVNLTTCNSSYQTRKVTLWEKQMCAGGERGRDSCKGDSGGPLMYENGRTYEVVGIVSFGPLPCGLENVPGVYTKVYEYNNWIYRTIVQ